MSAWGGVGPGGGVAGLPRASATMSTAAAVRGGKRQILKRPGGTRWKVAAKRAGSGAAEVWVSGPWLVDALSLARSCLRRVRISDGGHRVSAYWWGRELPGQGCGIW